MNQIHLLIFGGIAVICIRYLNPLLFKLTDRIPETINFVLEIILSVLLLADVVCCIAVIFQIQHSIRAARFVEQVQDFTEGIGNVLTKAISKRIEKAYPNIERDKVLHTPAKEKE